MQSSVQQSMFCEEYPPQYKIEKVQKCEVLRPKIQSWMKIVAKIHHILETQALFSLKIEILKKRQ